MFHSVSCLDPAIPQDMSTYTNLIWLIFYFDGLYTSSQQGQQTIFCGPKEPIKPSKNLRSTSFHHQSAHFSTLLDPSHSPPMPATSLAKPFSCKKLKINKKNQHLLHILSVQYSRTALSLSMKYLLKKMGHNQIWLLLLQLSICLVCWPLVANIFSTIIEVVTTTIVWGQYRDMRLQIWWNHSNTTCNYCKTNSERQACRRILAHFKDFIMH